MEVIDNNETHNVSINKVLPILSLATSIFPYIHARIIIIITVKINILPTRILYLLLKSLFYPYQTFSSLTYKNIQKGFGILSSLQV